MTTTTSSTPEGPVRYTLDHYAARCAEAATRQGLDPVVGALSAVGIECDVEQTGGFTMVVTVRHPGGVVAVIDDGGYLVGAYPGTAWDDGDSDLASHTFGLTLDQMVATVGSYL